MDAVGNKKERLRGLLSPRASADQSDSTLKRVYDCITQKKYDSCLTEKKGSKPVDLVAPLLGKEKYGTDVNKTLAEVLLERGKGAGGLEVLQQWRDKYGGTVSYRAAQLNQSDLLLKLLCNHGFQTDKCGEKERNPLAAAAQCGAVEAFRTIAEHKDGRGLLNDADKQGQQPIHLATHNKSSKLLEMICEDFNIDVGVEGLDGNTPLHCAIIFGRAMNATYLIGRIQLVRSEHLLERVNDRKESPVHLAARHGLQEVIDLLLSAGVGHRFKDAKRSTVLHHAVEGKNLETVAGLLEKDLSLINEVNSSGETPLQVAIRLNHSVIANRLRTALQQWSTSTEAETLQIRGIVFKGGGVKGIGEIGAWDRLCETMRSGDYPSLSKSHIRRVAGTSAGAIMATMVALRYEPKEMRPILREFGNFKEIFEPASGVEGVANKAMKLLQSEAPSFALIPKVITFRAAPELWNYYKNPWLCDGEKLLEKIKQLLVDKGLRHDVTFKELHDTGWALDLWVVATNVRRRRSDIFNWQRTGSACVADAVRASASFPGFFKPHYRFDKVDGQRVCSKEEPLVDGGIMLNYPVRVFDGIDDPRSTLGVRIVKHRRTAEGSDFEEELGASSGLNAVDLIMGYGGSLDRVAGQFEDLEEERSILISDMETGTLDSGLTDAAVDALIMAGGKGVDEYFKRYGKRFEKGAGRLRLVEESGQLEALVKHMKALSIDRDAAGRFISRWEQGSNTPSLLVELLEACEQDGRKKEITLTLIETLKLSANVVGMDGPALAVAAASGSERAVEVLLNDLKAEPDGIEGHRPLDSALQIEDSRARKAIVRSLVLGNSSECENSNKKDLTVVLKDLVQRELSKDKCAKLQRALDRLESVSAAQPAPASDKKSKKKTKK